MVKNVYTLMWAKAANNIVHEMARKAVLAPLVVVDVSVSVFDGAEVVLEETVASVAVSLVAATV